MESAVGMGGGPEYPSRAAHAEALIHEKVNERREANGLPSLERNEQLDEVAQYHSDDMAEQDYFAHTSPGGETVQQRYAEFGIRCAGGENIFSWRGYNRGPIPTAEKAMEVWMRSPGHSSNILGARFRAEGVGVTFEDPHVYVTQNFC